MKLFLCYVSEYPDDGVKVVAADEECQARRLAGITADGSVDELPDPSTIESPQVIID